MTEPTELPATQPPEKSPPENKWSAEASYETSADDETPPAPPEPSSDNAEIVEPSEDTNDKDRKVDDNFDPITAPEYDWNAALITVRKTDPNNNLYREGSSFSKLINQISEGEIVPADIKKGKDYRRLRNLQKNAEKGGIPIPSKEANGT